MGSLENRLRTDNLFCRPRWRPVKCLYRIAETYHALHGIETNVLFALQPLPSVHTFSPTDSALHLEVLLAPHGSRLLSRFLELFLVYDFGLFPSHVRVENKYLSLCEVIEKYPLLCFIVSVAPE